jgi:hypothetical protein
MRTAAQASQHLHAAARYPNDVRRYAAWLMRTSRTSCDFIVLAATALVTQFLESFKEFPPRQKAASFTIDQVVEKLEAAITSHR